MRTALGRADLVRAIANLPPAWAARSAAVLGFEAVPEVEEIPASSAVAFEPSAPAVPVMRERVALGPLLRFEEMTFDDEVKPAEMQPVEVEGLDEDDLDGGGSIFETPAPVPLAPWSRLWPLLRAQLQVSLRGRMPDVSALVRAMGRGEIVHRIPCVARRAWPARASVWVDRSPRLGPFWSDQREVCHGLWKACGRGGVEVRLLDARTQAKALARRRDLLAGFQPDPQVPVLVLGDLGTYGTLAERAAWRATARSLRRDGVHVAALVPSPRSRWDAPTAEAWSAEPWERGRRRGAKATHEPQFWQERAERLLRLAAPAALVQPGLLRALRLLLPAWQADAATEADAWTHPDVLAADASGLVLHPEASTRLRQAFAREVEGTLKVEVSAAIGVWHQGLPRELIRVETLAWHALIAEGEAPPPGKLDEALAFARRLEAMARRREVDPERAAVVRRFERLFLASLPEVAYEVVPGLKLVWASAFQGVDGVRVPAGIDPGALQAELGLVVGAPVLWGIRQVGNRLVFSPCGARGAWPSEGNGPGSPVAWLWAAGPLVWVKAGRVAASRQLVLRAGLSVVVPAGEEIVVRTDRGEVVLRRWEPEPWAAAGRDKFGLWADADIKGVVQRFRWIPPGRFMMGSPESEAGRHDNEGLQHEVTWTTGMWLADTPVTQALWQAVMGKNPSTFKSPTRPVENVSWDDCRQFMRAIDDVAPELLARLPGEAEWEYACRAGTETATWLGDLEILGENNAPLLDEIAWYGGNSGQEFELAEGYDSKDWPNKQYPHTKAGSRPVRGKDPNPLGLHDMLGNVLEWCEDMYLPYGAERSARAPAGSNRVYRGGSWSVVARRVRAADRGADSPGLRYDDLGFRLARGLAPSQGAEPQVRGGGAPQGRRAEPPTAGDGAGRTIAPLPEKRKSR